MLRNFYFTLKINQQLIAKKLKFNYTDKKQLFFLFFDIHKKISTNV